jgi:uncharacterized protein DUF6325
MTEVIAEIGPVDYLVVEFPGNKMTGEGLPILVDLHDRGIIQILDLVFVSKALDGTVSGLAISDFDADGALDLAVFEGVRSGLIGDDDVAEASGALEPGNAAGILLYANTWAAPFASALLRGGAQVVASGRIPAEDLVAALDSADQQA